MGGGAYLRQDDADAREKYPAKAHLAAVVAHLPAERKSNYILLTGGRELPIGSSDQSYPFIQESFYYYCSGLRYPDTLLLYDIARAHLTFFVPRARTGRDIVYLGQRPSPRQIAQETDVDAVLYADAALPDILASVGGIFYTLADAALCAALTRARSIKDAHELRLLRMAADVSDAAHAAVGKAVRLAQTEQTLDTLFRSRCLAARIPLGAGAGGGLQFSYTPIVAAGQHASTLHYTAPPGTDSPLHGAELVLVDAAASVHYYASDVTRTYPRTGKFTPLARKLYALVLDMQERSIALLKAGVKMSQVAECSHRILSRAMVDFEWVNCSLETVHEHALSKAFLMHGIGHHVGLDVHDVTPINDAPCMLHENASIYSDLPLVGARPAKVTTANNAARTTDSEAALEAGNVVTVEPGVYFNEEYLQTFYDSPSLGKFFNKHRINEWKALGGVRIEDVLLVTKDGHEFLSHAPKSIHDIEALCSQ